MNSNGGTADAQATTNTENDSRKKPTFRESILAKVEQIQDDKVFLTFVKGRYGLSKRLLFQCGSGETLLQDTEEDRERQLDALYAELDIGNGGDPEPFISKKREKDKAFYREYEKAEKQKNLALNTRGEDWGKGTGRIKQPKRLPVMDDEVDESKESKDEDAELLDPNYKCMKNTLLEIVGILVRYSQLNTRACAELQQFKKLTAEEQKSKTQNEKQRKALEKHKGIRKYYGQLKTWFEVIQSWMVDFEAHAYDNREPVIVSMGDYAPISLIENYQLITVKIINLEAEWVLFKVDHTKEHVVCMELYTDDTGVDFGLDDLNEAENAYLESLGPDKFKIFDTDKTDFEGDVRVVRFAIDNDLFELSAYIEPEKKKALKQDPTFKLRENGDGVDDSLDGASGKEVKPEEVESTSDSESDESESEGEEFDSGTEYGSDEDSDDEPHVPKRKSAAPVKPAAHAAAPAAAPAAMTTKNPFQVGSALWCLQTRLTNNMITEEQAREILKNLIPIRESEDDKDDFPLCHRQTTPSIARDLTAGASSKRDVHEGPSSKKPRKS